MASYSRDASHEMAPKPHMPMTRRCAVLFPFFLLVYVRARPRRASASPTPSSSGKQAQSEIIRDRAERDAARSFSGLTLIHTSALPSSSSSAAFTLDRCRATSPGGAVGRPWPQTRAAAAAAVDVARPLRRLQDRRPAAPPPPRYSADRRPCAPTEDVFATFHDSRRRRGSTWPRADPAPPPSRTAGTRRRAART